MLSLPSPVRVALLVAPMVACACTASLEGHFVRSGDGDGSVALLPDDGADPILVLAAPAIGAVMPGTEIRFVGRVTDDSPVTLATDAGETIPVAADGSFDHPISVAPGAHRVRIVATDGSGRSAETFTAFVSGDFVDAETIVEGAVLADVSSRALAEIAHRASVMLTETNFSPEVNARNPITDGWWGEVNLRGESHGAVTVSLMPAAGTITATVEIAQISVGARASTRIGSASGELEAENVRVTVVLALSAEGGRLVGAVESSSVELGDVGIDINNFPDAVEDLSSVRDAIRRKVEQGLEDAVVDRLPSLIADGLASIPEGETIDALDTTLEIQVAVSAFEIDSAGIGAAIDVGIQATAPVDSRDLIGYLSIPHTAAPTPGADLSIAIAYDALNAPFAALWASGVLDQRIEGIEFGGGPFTAGALGLLLPFTTGSVPGGSPLVIDVSPHLAPMIVPLADGALQVQAEDIRVTFIALVDGAEVEIATLSVGIYATADPHIEDGVLSVDLGGLAISADVVDGVATAPTGEDLDALLEDVIPAFAPGILGGAAVTVPVLYGSDVTPTHVSTSGGYLTLEAALP